MEITLDYDFKQSYNLDSLYVKDLTVYDGVEFDTLIIRFWDYSYGTDITSVPLNEQFSVSYSTENLSDDEWTILMSEFKQGRFIHASEFNLYTIPDGIYNFAVEIYSEEGIFNSVSAFGFYQETENAYIKQHLSYDWTQRYKENNAQMYELAKVSNWFQALELSIRPGSLIGNFKVILHSLRKYLKLE